LLLATATAGAARTVLGVDSDDAVTFGALTAPSLRASTSGGLLLSSSNGTTVATIGAGPGTGVTFAGGVNMQALGCMTVTASGIISSSKASAASPITDANSSLKLYDGSLGAGLFGMQTSGAPYSYQFQVAEATMASYFPLHLQPRGGASIFGTDPNPGGPELVRVGGAVLASLTSVTNPSLILRYNSSSVYGHHLMDGNGNYVIATPSANGVAGGRINIRASGVDIAQFLSNAVVFGTDPGGSELLRVGGSGRIGGNLFLSGILNMGTYTPASASDTGTAGYVCWDASYLYVCTAANTWKRVAIATW
jgi:hypothetical protein